MSSFSEFCRTVLKSKLDRGSPCLVLFLISSMLLSLFVSLYRCFLDSVNLLQEADVLVFDTAGLECFPNWFVCNGVECLREVDSCCPHFDSPLVAFLLNHSVRRKVVCCLVWAFESSLVFRLNLVESWIYSSVQYCREQFVQRWQWADRASHFFCITFIVTYFHASSVNSFCMERIQKLQLDRRRVVVCVPKNWRIGWKSPRNVRNLRRVVNHSGRACRK